METLLQTVILILPIYALLAALLVTRPRETSLSLPHTRWGKPRRKNRPKRRGTHILRRGPGDFIIEEEKPKPRGKPKGARGGARRTPEKVDYVREAIPSRCPHCGAKIPRKQKPRNIHLRRVIDLEEVERGLIGTRTLWKVHWKRCPKCGKLASGGDQVNAEKGYTYGYGAMAYAVRQHIEHGTPPAEIARNLHDILKEDAPTAQTIRDWINHTAQKNKSLLQELLKAAKKEKYLEVDETGLPLDGKKNWLWIISTPTVTIYLARKTRGHQAVEGELKDYVGRLITDFWKAYGKLPHRKQRCLTHLCRKLISSLQKQVETLNKLSEALKRSGEKQQREEEKSGKGKRNPRKRELGEEEKKQYVQRIAELRITTEALYQILVLFKDAMEGRMNAEQAKKRLLTLLEENRAAESLSEDYRRVSKLIRKHIDELFVFLEEPDLPYSTNAA